MQNKKSKQASGSKQNTQDNSTFNNQNLNQNHNAKKESLGPNTKR